MDSWKQTSPLAPLRLLAKSPGGAVVTTCVSRSYARPVLLVLQGRLPCSVVLPCASEAEAAARFAVSHLGGYRVAQLVPAPGARAVLRSWREWAYGYEASPTVPGLPTAPLPLLTGRSSVQA